MTQMMMLLVRQFNSFMMNLRKEKYYDEKAMVPLTSRGDKLSEKYFAENF